MLLPNPFIDFHCDRLNAYEECILQDEHESVNFAISGSPQRYYDVGIFFSECISALSSKATGAQRKQFTGQANEGFFG